MGLHGTLRADSGEGSVFGGADPHHNITRTWDIERYIKYYPSNMWMHGRDDVSPLQSFKVNFSRRLRVRTLTVSNRQMTVTAQIAQRGHM